MTAPVHLHVLLQRDERGYPPVQSEALDASQLAGDLYRLEGVPVFACGLARGDVVRVIRAIDRTLWIRDAVEASGHWTARILPADAAQGAAAAEEFRALGCDALATPFGLVAIDVPETTSAARALEALRAGERAGRWEFDLGVAPPGPDWRP